MVYVPGSTFHDRWHGPAPSCRLGISMYGFSAIQHITDSTSRTPILERSDRMPG